MVFWVTYLSDILHAVLVSTVSNLVTNTRRKHSKSYIDRKKTSARFQRAQERPNP